MSFININSAFTDQLISALCGTLIYSLLQGVALAAVAGLIVVFTRKATSAVRYNLLIGALGLFAISSCLTFASKLGHVESNVQIINSGPGNNNLVIIDNTVPTAKTGLIDITTTWLNTNHNIIVLVWFLIICAKCIQLATGLQGVYRLKNTSIFAVPDEWRDKVIDMSARLGIKQKIAVLESGLAKVPMVVGHLKPVILIPVGLLTALTTAEVEAILMHELAHIRRRDYLVNLLQSLVEIVFFFNPAVLWVSQLIKTERENCCDDMALAQNANKSSYIMALVSAQEYQQTAPAYAMGFPGQKNHLLGRVKRMVNNRNHSLDTFETTLLTICLVTAGICFSAYAEKDNIKKAVHAVATVIKHPKFNHAEQRKLDEETHQLDNQTAKPDSQTAEADSRTAALDSTEPGVPPAGTAKSTADTVIKPLSDTARLQKKAAQPSLSALSPNSIHLSGSLGPLRTRMSLAGSIPLTVTVNDTVPVAIVAKPAVTAKPVPSPRTAVPPKPAKISPVAASAKPVPSPRAAVPPKPTLVQPYVTEYKPDTSIYNKSRAKYAASSVKYGERREEAINDLIKDGLIKTRDNLSFKLSTNEFIVNYKKMSEDVFEKYRAKYVKPNPGGNWTWMYNYDAGKHQETNTVIDNAKN